MQELPLSKAFTLLETGPVTLITTHDSGKNNIMTISWTMVLGFSAQFAMTTGPWNYSYAALEASRECVIAIPTADMLDTVVGIGTCSGLETDKFQRFGLTAQQGKYVHAPLIKECLANIECRIVDFVERHSILVLNGIAAYYDEAHTDKRQLHAVGDGTFIADGEHFDRKAMMRSKLPEGV